MQGGEPRQDPTWTAGSAVACLTPEGPWTPPARTPPLREEGHALSRITLPHELRGWGHAQAAPAACTRHDRSRPERASLYTAERFPPNPPKSRQ